MESKKAKSAQKTNDFFNVEEAPLPPMGALLNPNFVESSPIGDKGAFFY